MPTENKEVDQPVVDAVVDTPEVVELSDDEKLATSRGWKPKDEWDGPEDEWKPAKVFNQIGDLRDQLTAKDKDLRKTNKVLQMVKDHHLNVRQAAVQEALKELKGQRVAALEEQDFGTAEKIRDQIDDIGNRFRNEQVLPAHIEREVKANTNEPDPELFAFMERNRWYKPNSDDTLSKKADALGWAYKNENPDMPFKDIIKAVESDIKKLFPEKFDTPRNPVNEAGSRGSSSTGTTVRARLSDEERAVAREFGMTDAEYAKELGTYKGR